MAVRTCIETLPSRGVLYGGQLPEGKVEIRAMTTDEEAIMVSNKGERIAMLDRIIRNCLVNCPVQLDKMLDADRTYLLFAIRNLTFGPKYSITIPCANPACRQTFTVDVNLQTDLRVKQLEDTDEEIVEVEMPSGTVLGFHRLTVEEDRDVLEFARKRGGSASAASDPRDPSYAYRLARHLKTKDGSPLDPTEALNLFPLPSDDSLALTQAIEDFSCGIDLELSHACPFCGATSKQNLQFTEEFFRPSARRYKVRGRSNPIPRPA